MRHKMSFKLVEVILFSFADTPSSPGCRLEAHYRRNPAKKGSAVSVVGAGAAPSGVSLPTA